MSSRWRTMRGVQNQDQDQDQRNVFREIGNVNVNIENDIAIAILAILAFAAGSMDGAGVQDLLNRLISDKNNA